MHLFGLIIAAIRHDAFMVFMFAITNKGDLGIEMHRSYLLAMSEETYVCLAAETILD